MPLLDVQNLSTHFLSREGPIRAVEEVSFSLEAGETLGFVGESGCGKSVTCLSLLRLLPMPPARIVSGRALFEGQDLLALPDEQLRKWRGHRLSMVFQDPMSALNPYLSIGRQVMEPLQQHLNLSRSAAQERALVALAEAGLPEAERVFQSYPHMLSGGMRQRVMITMALITRPQLLIADEPTTALDVTLQAQILDLLAAAQRRLGLAVLLVSHDFSVIARACQRVAVFYAGRIVEYGPTADILRQPRHPYTAALQASQPALARPGQRLQALPGQPPDLRAAWVGDAFARRLGQTPRQTMVPPLVEVAPGHWARESEVPVR